MTHDSDGMTADEVREILEHKERRDRFAIAALPGVMSMALKDFGSGVDWKIEEMAEAAYKTADAMIKARDA